MKHAIRTAIIGALTVTVISFFFYSMANSQDEGLKIRLSEASGPGERKEPLKSEPPPAEVLPADELSRLLRRVPVVKSGRKDEATFSLRDRSLPPPRTGETIESAFPPVERMVAPPLIPEPLRIVRFAPEGESGVVPFMSVTFSQPMVELGRENPAAEVPVRLTPQPPGRWRWIGTSTLLFEPEGRFPMATRYRVEVPAGTRSAIGNTLAEARNWEFFTTPPKLVTGLSGGQSASRDPLIYLEFDQKIDAEVLRERVQLKAAGRIWPLRPATREEIEADENAVQKVKQAVAGRWIAFRLDRKNGGSELPTSTDCTVEIPAGIQFGEGPLGVKEPVKYSFKTYEPFALAEFKCGWKPKSEICSPDDQWQLTFNNPVSTDFDPGLIRIEPALPDADISRLYGGEIFIRPRAKPRTRYTITIDGKLRDIHGQELGKDITARIETSGLDPWLNLPGNDGLIVLDPAGLKQISVYSVNHESFRAKLYSVGPEHYGQFMEALRARYSYQRNDPPPFPEIGRRVLDQMVRVESRQDEITVTPIDLSPVLKDGFGQALLIVEPTINVTTPGGPLLIARWIQSTGIAMDVFTDGESMLAWANSLKDGSPLEGVNLELIAEQAPGRSILKSSLSTSSDGTVRFQLPAADGRKVLVARKGGDLAILPEYSQVWAERSTWKREQRKDWLRWHVIDDRGIYRPGEEVSVKGWVRRADSGPLGDIVLASELNRRLLYVARDSQGNELASGLAMLTPLGGFDLRIKLPSTVNLGRAVVEIIADGDKEKLSGLDHQHVFQVQEFRRPEFEVKVTAGEGPHFVGGHTEVTLEAKYFAGGGLPDSEVSWSVNTEPTNYTPPNRGDFTFGSWIPWWTSAYETGDSEEFKGRTDMEGRHRLRIDFESVDPPRPSRVQVLGAVDDVNRQNLAGSTDFIVHPADHYVGLRSQRLFVERGADLVVESIVTDLDGKLIPGREITMRAVRVDWKYEKGEWKEREFDPQTCSVKSAVDPVLCRFTARLGGRYRITGDIRDDRERRNQSELTLWVSGGSSRPNRTLTQEKIEPIPDKREYRSGETAEILVQAPFAPAEGVVTLMRDGIVSTGRFRVESNSYTLRIPILESYVPNLKVRVDLVGETWRTDEEGNQLQNQPKRPAFASGEIDLEIPPYKRRLAVTAVPRQTELEPGGRTSVAVTVRDSTGRPVRGSDVTLIVVDEAILSLTNYKLADPIASFYTKREKRLEDHHLRSQVELAQLWEMVGLNQTPSERVVTSKGVLSLMATRAGFMGAGSMADSVQCAVGMTGDAGVEIRSRVNFNPLAVFAAVVVTNAAGRATVPVKLPDNLTKYRVMAIAASGENSFGTAESAITARLPLMVRPSAPRFLNYGDRFELPVVVQNQTGKAMTVDLAVRAANLQLFDSRAAKGASTAGRRVTVPANDRVEVRFPAGTVLPGVARFRIAGVSGTYSDAAEISLPVWTPATTEAVAVYGEIDGGPIRQPVKPPEGAIREFGGLEITTSSTQLQALTDAALYLQSYPYECAEQVASRILANVALRDTLKAFSAKGLPDPSAVEQSVLSDIRKLEAMQNDDGGFGFWRSGEESWPYLSIHAAHALALAREKGFRVPEDMIEASGEYLKEADQNIPADYPESLRRSLMAYSFYVSRLMGENVSADALEEIAEAGGVDKYPLEALGWLLPVLSGDARGKARVVEIGRILNSRAEETSGTASFTTRYDDRAWLLLHSDRRTDAVLLGGLIDADPANDLIPKLARGLLAHRRRGRWSNTQENAFALLALDRYFKVFEKETPDFIARAWYGEAYAGSHPFKGRSTDSSRISVPMSLLARESAAKDLILSKEGRGRMYYRLAVQYAPSNLTIDPYDAGFTVNRSYEAVDDPNDVRREEDGTWRIKAGARVRVRLTMIARSRRYHVALVDPLPAGFEALNPELATTEDLPEGDLRWRRWFEHQNMRDDRVEAFTTELPEGIYTYVYYARTTTPGIFQVAPAKAEEMYAPETFGRSGSTRVIIE